MKADPYWRFKRGPDSHNWKGMNVNYVSKHLWIIKNYGKANHCEHDPAHTGRRYDWANISGKYLREIEDYKQLCRSCHRIMDNGNYCRQGHEYTADNTRMKQKSGDLPYRQCRKCDRVARRLRYERLGV